MYKIACKACPLKKNESTSIGHFLHLKITADGPLIVYDNGDSRKFSVILSEKISLCGVLSTARQLITKIYISTFTDTVLKTLHSTKIQFI